MSHGAHEAPQEFAPLPAGPPRGCPDTNNRRLLTWTAAITLILVASGGTAIALKHRSDVVAKERRVAADAKEAEARAALDEREAEREAATEADLGRARAAYDACSAEISPFMNVLENVNARLNVGMSQQDLSGLIGDASVEYQRIDIESLGTGTCLSVGAKLESAFNKYNATVSEWNTCIYDTSCSLDEDVLPAMQKKWGSASLLIDIAGSLLATLDPDGDSYGEDTSPDLGGT